MIGRVERDARVEIIPILTLMTESDAAKRDQVTRRRRTGWISLSRVSGDDLIRVIKKVLPGA